MIDTFIMSVQLCREWKTFGFTTNRKPCVWHNK